MKVAAVLLFIVGHACARPEFGVERKYEPQDVQAQQLNAESDTASLPYTLHTTETKSNFNAKMYLEGAMIPVQLVYEPHSENGDTQAIARHVSSETTHGQRGPAKKILNRVARSHDFFADLFAGNDIPTDDYKKNPEGPTPEMYNDNFGGEHDSQEGVITEDALRSQHLSYDADAYNRALGIDARIGARNTANSSTATATSESAVTEKGVVRRIQHYQTVALPSGMFLPTLTESSIPNGNIDVSRALWANFPNQLRPHVGSDHMRSPLVFQGRSLNNFAPFSMTSPYNGVWSAYTNIVEYAPHDEPCKNTNIRKKRDTGTQGKKKKRVETRPEETQHQEPEVEPGYQEFFVEDLGRTPGSTGPRIMKLKVRRGGVAIAGPGGIATAGSGGTAIVGPGGTAYTTQDGTAVVGPGGRVIEIPSNFQFHTTKVEARNNDPHSFFIPPGGKILGEGPFVYYGRNQNNPPTITPIIERL